MVERLLFNRIDVNRNRAPINEAAHLTVDVYPGAAFAALPGAEEAALGTEKALDDSRFAGMGVNFEVFPGLVALQTVNARRSGGDPISRLGS